jgi:hypothetical protein
MMTRAVFGGEAGGDAKNDRSELEPRELAIDLTTTTP